jgi:hypothetical protein
MGTQAASPQDLLREVSFDKVWSHIEHITEKIPSRLAGSPNSRKMVEYSHNVFQKAGLESKIHEFRGFVSFPEEAAVRLISPERREIESFTLGHSASTDGIEGELVYVGSGAEKEYEGKDVRGKITLSELSYSPARHEKALVAFQRGSVAQIMMNWGDENNEALPFGSMKSAWGNPTPETMATEMPDLPCVGIARTEGLLLKDLCARGPVRVWLRAKAENGWKPLSMNSAEFGAAGDGQFLLLGGHTDSWFGPQATDNAAGNACIMELARVFCQHRDRLRRGLVAGLWMGHETGTMISSTRFADVNWDRLRSSCVAYMQIDQPGIAGGTVWTQRATDDIQTYALQTVREVAGEIPIRANRMPKNGDASFFGVGLPGLQGGVGYTDEELKRTALATLGWWHHSILNTVDKLDKKLLALCLRVYARWVLGLLTEPILPCEYLPLATRFVDRLSELAKIQVPDIDMAGAVERAKDFQQQAQWLDEQAQAWRRRRQAGADGEKAAASLNRAMIALSRTLVPIASTVVGPYGQDRYGHPWQTQMIPSLVPYGNLAKYSPDSQEYQLWWVAMVRMRNRVVDALQQATAFVRQTRKDLA